MKYFFTSEDCLRVLGEGSIAGHVFLNLALYKTVTQLSEVGDQAPLLIYLKLNNN